METSKLKDILDQHQLWLDGKGGKRAKLWSASLKSVNLTGANLKSADLDSADLYCADLTRANLCGANLCGANLTGANLTRANLCGAYLAGANLHGAILPDISWIIPGCLVQLNRNNCGFYLEKEAKWEDFVQDSFGFFIQNNVAERTFDMLAGDRIIRNIPDWVKYSGLKQIASESV